MVGKDYRLGVVGVFINKEGFVLVGERNNEIGQWQFPQGGVDEGETPVEAIIREMREEVGCQNFDILKTSPTLTYYDFPPNSIAKIASHYVGQKQYWFLLKFKDDEQPSLDQSDNELRAFKWSSINEVIENVIYWKKEAYSHGLKMLELI